MTSAPTQHRCRFSPLVMRVLVSALALGVGACSTRMPAPVEDRSVASRAPSRTTAPPTTAAPPAVPRAAELEQRPQSYTVKRGDTLQMIALDHGLDYRELAAWNNIENVNRIFAGQVLRLTPPGEGANAAAAAAGSAAATPGVTTAPLRTVPPVAAGSGAPAATSGAPAERPPVVASRNSDTYKTQPKAVKEPYSEHALREMQRAAGAGSAAGPAVAAATPPTRPEPEPRSTQPAVASAGAQGGTTALPEPNPPATVARAEPRTEPRSEPKPEARPEPRSTPGGEDDDEKLEWVWPTSGKLVTGFSDTANLKGIDISGKAGQPVVASATGKVVYAGSGLRGYGKLIIIKHSKNYLSAYAHNKDILVKEGQQVTRGQKIAEMGNSDADQVKLHFEIRRLGKPMDPLKYLPPA